MFFTVTVYWARLQRLKDANETALCKQVLAIVEIIVLIKYLEICSF